MTCYRHSTIPYPVAKVHELYARHRMLSRGEFIELCKAEGINHNTAATQYNVCRRAEHRTASQEAR